MPTREALQVMEDQAEALVVLPIGQDVCARVRRVARLACYPSYIASRIPARAVLERLVERIRNFAPDLIWLEGVHPSWLALELQRRLKLPLAYRSHNIEFRYVAEQARLARSARLKLALTAGTWGLERAEHALHGAADHVFDISSGDLAWWRKQGFVNNSWLATQPDPGVLATAAAPFAKRDIDLLFVGSLSSPNNVAGLNWYLDRVLPLFPENARPSLTIAGRSPSSALIARAVAAGAVLIPNPRDVAPLFARARVMLNPIFHGSGVNIKTIDMLATGRPVVTTTIGARGLPADVVAELDVADTPEGFLDAIRATLMRDTPVEREQLIERVFGIDAVAEALARFEAHR